MTIAANLCANPTNSWFFVDHGQSSAAALDIMTTLLDTFWIRAMLTPTRVMLLFAAVVAWLPAQAQFLGPGIRTNIALTSQDLETIRGTVDAQVHGKPVGTAAKWSNPHSGNSGKITLVRKFMRNGQQCETLDYRLATSRRPVRPEHYRLSSCLQPDGQWKLI